jgi:hypothetical protein
MTGALSNIALILSFIKVSTTFKWTLMIYEAISILNAVMTERLPINSRCICREIIVVKRHRRCFTAAPCLFIEVQLNQQCSVNFEVSRDRPN